MRVLGINCTSNEAYIALVAVGSVVPTPVERLRPASGTEMGERLLEFVDEVKRAVAQNHPDHAVLLQPEASQPAAKYSRHMPRIVIETLVRLALAQEKIPLDIYSRPTVRSRLNLPKTGSLDSHLGVLGEPVGQYWSQGRGLAALAAAAYGGLGATKG